MMTAKTETEGLFTKTIDSLIDPTWWGDNLAGFLVFSILVGIMSAIIRWIWAKYSRRKYVGWRLVVIPKVDDRKRGEYKSTLLWDEVRKFEESPFEDRKFIQSVCTSENVRIKSGQIDTSQHDSWVYKDMECKRYRFNFNHIPEDILIKSKPPMECGFQASK